MATQTQTQPQVVPDVVPGTTTFVGRPVERPIVRTLRRFAKHRMAVVGMIVMIGMRALRNAWRVMTIRCGRPLATAVVTYREPSTSSMDERV